jgi:hypothetical protein
VQIVGETNQLEVWIASKHRKFRINEFLVINDEELRFPIATVIETRSFNRFIPLSTQQGFVDAGVIQSLRAIGYNIEEDEMNIAKARLLTEAPYPVRTGSEVRLPDFEEVRGLLIGANPDRGLVLGTIKSSEDVSVTMPHELLNVALPFRDGDFLPQDGVPFILDPRQFQQYPHVGIFGGSGSGKSFALRVYLEELMKLNVPVIAFDPHFEMDFSSQVPNIPKSYATDYSRRYVSYTIGRDIGVQFTHLNTRDLINLLGAASQGGLSDSMANGVETLHKKADSYHTFSRRVDLLAEALDLGKSGIERQLKSGADDDRIRLEECRELYEQYSSLPLPSIRGLAWRLRRLYQAGIFNRDIKPVESGVKAGQLVVIQGPIWIMQVFASYVISNLYRQRRDYKDAQFRQDRGEFFPPFVIATDEVHHFAPKAYESPSKSVIKEIAQEGRKYGVFLILASQRPALLDETVTAQLNTKCIFRTVRASDIDTIIQETDISREEARSLPFLPSGDCYVSSAIWGRTLSVRIRGARTMTPHRENPFDELESMIRDEEEILYQQIQRYLPIYPNQWITILSVLGQSSDGWDMDTLGKRLARMVDGGRLAAKETPFGLIYEEKK